jgi:hypothetical protein
MSTYTAKPSDITKKWVLIDATDLVVGRLASIVALHLRGKHLQMWGEQGTELGQLAYPYALYFDPDGNLEICEYGNNRVQKFTPEGKSLGAWGEPGHREKQLFNPWSCVRDSTGRTIILDSLNHRVQVVRL